MHDIPSFEIDLTNFAVSQLLKLILKILLPILLKVGLVVLVIGIIAMIIFGLLKEKEKQKAGAIVADSYSFDLPAVEEKWITAGGEKFALPIKQDLTKTEKLMLMGIRIPEFGSRSNSNLDGDRDSFCPYQQRASELYRTPYLEAKTREITGNYFDKIFMEERKQFINQYRDSQLRKIYYPITQRYGVKHGWTGQHFGIDYGYNFNTLVSSSISGEVIGLPYDQLGGQMVIIYNEQMGIRQIQGHLSKPIVKVGQKIGIGEAVAYSGNSGIATTAAHLHYQITKGKDGDINTGTLDPDTQPYLSLIQSNQLYAISAQLVDIHLKTGLCDALALERLRNEPATKNWLNQEIKKQDLPNLVKALCLSQRPIDCSVWESRSLSKLNEIYDQI